MSFDLYFASSGNTEMGTLLDVKQCNRLFTQLEKSSINKCISRKVSSNPRKLFIDSGAFTSWTKSITVDVDAYIDFVNSIDSDIDLIAQVDCIPGMFGVPRTLEDKILAPEKSWENYLYMKDRVKSRDKLIPIFHQEEDYKWLRNMLDYRHSDGKPIQYIGISPANDRSQADKEEFIARSFDIIKHSSNPNVKTHGFGMTNFRILERYPYTSADSTSWKLSAAYGSILTSYGAVLVSNAQKSDKSHILNMPEEAVELIKQQCSKYSLDFNKLGDSFGTRAMFNVNYMQDWADNYKCVYTQYNKRRLF